MTTTLSQVLLKNNNYKKLISKEKNLNVFVLRSYTCEILEKTLFVKGFENNFNINTTFGGFNQYSQEILDNTSELYTLENDIIFLTVNIEDLYPNILLESIDKNKVPSIIDFVISSFQNLIDTLLANSTSTIITSTFVAPSTSPVFSYNNTNINGLNNIISEINYKLISLYSKTNKIYFINTSEILLELGKENSYDYKMMSIAKNPYSISFYDILSNNIINILNCLYKPRKKCIVVDLDNTLWEGIVGEDGVFGIKINYFFKQIQQLLLLYKNTGLTLAICSKNNENDAIEVFEKNEDMILSLADFSIMKINWENKVNNIVNISKELNISTDSIIFIDDSKFECEHVKHELPEVDVYCLDKSPTENLTTIKNMKNVNFLSLTEEDLNKTLAYKSEFLRKSHNKKFTNITNYLKSLEIVIDIEDIGDSNIDRIVQLINKTNQFNLTTKRYSKLDVLTMINDGFIIYGIKASDKFGNLGLIGVCIIKEFDNVWEIDSLLLSCRALKRKIENNFIAFIVNEAKNKNISLIKGFYVETPKNGQVKDLYPSLNFEYDELNDCFTFDFKENIKYDSFIKINYQGEEIEKN